MYHKLRGIFNIIISLFFYKKIRKVDKILIFLGPYRNLSTISASLLSLHPNCQVLNHAGERILSKNQLNFLKFPTKSRFNNFKKFSLYASMFGKTGHYGGSILHSHAFRNKELKDKYNSRYSSSLKKHPTCIVWKESLRVSNYLKKNQINIPSLLSEFPQLQFVLPIRNPIDCAHSNLKTGHSELFESPAHNLEDCIKEIYKEFLFFINLKKKFPNRFHYLYQNNLTQDLFELSYAIGLKKDNKWCKDVIEVFQLKNSHYNKEKMVKEKYIKQATIIFKNHPEFKKNLLLLMQ